MIRGAAGTGKSTLLSSLLVALSERSRRRTPGDVLGGTTVRILVNHAEMWRRYRDMAASQECLRKAQVLRPTSYINASDKRSALSGRQGGADIALVDEAHLLLTQPNPYTRFHAENQLSEIVRLSKVTVIAYDENQVLRLRSRWDEDVLDKALAGAWTTEIRLDDQHRMGASREIRGWVRSFALGGGPVTPPPPGDGHFEMKVFRNAGAMRDAVLARDVRGPSRLLSTYDYPYRLDGKDYFIEEEGLRIPWDRYQPQAASPWPQRPETVKEVGSVYTIQGMDLDWAGVILGPSNTLDGEGRLRPLPELYQDQAAFTGVARLKTQGMDADAIEHSRICLLRNALMTLLTRPRKGLFLYAHDPRLLRALLPEE
ncbi:MAG: DNA/RNA helicase domain-containing protein [Bifidobacterium psychraerophilum]|uniref:DNA/RNA helicase domain-containing protein n=1 Tax=Bifidobacterium psychraerophilum TaxID=218140 RepID=UPI0039E99960